jgi:prepilin signal peptidase PulO-like enzyme (type II secretory pathway)
MTFAFPYLDQIKTVLIDAAPGMPPEIWWVTACVLLILALAALVDAFTTTVPDVIIFLGLFAITLMQGLFASWEIAAQHLQQAIAVGLFIFAINYAWVKKFHTDALGMGDAKWTMLAVACFGIESAVLAWGIGSVLATIFIGLFRLFKYQMSKVTFSPFLFIGLGLGLYAARFW